MQVETPPAAPRPPQWTEYHRVAVALPPDTTLHDDVRFVPIVWDSLRNQLVPRPSILGAGQHALPFFPRWRLMSLLCTDRAVRTVAGDLHNHIGQVAPERYLGDWREALDKPVTIETLAKQYSLCLHVTLAANLHSVRGARSPCPGSPFGTFEDFEALYGPRFVHVPEESGTARFGLSLDLREPDAARHAFYAEALLSSRSETQVRVRVTLGRLDRHLYALPKSGPQAVLFEETTP